MKLPTKTLLIVFATVVILTVLVYVLSRSKEKSQTHDNSDTQITADSTGSAVQPPESGTQSSVNQNNSNTGGTPYPSVQGKSPEQINKESQALVDLAERMKLKEKGQAQIKQIQLQMRKDEIVSLKNSIENDQKLLKKIEDSGTGIEDYKYVEENLKIRRARLKELTR